MKNLHNLSILITGGTGSFGNAMTNYLCKNYKLKRLVIFSRDELKQYNMQQKFPLKKYPFIRFFIGDIRDEKRLTRAFSEIDLVIHAAALKQVPTAEYNPFETINTNILGAQNVIEAALNTKVKKVIALSTDKASSPINLYGATKLCSDKLFSVANIYAGKRDISFSVVRYGNVMGSRGSVIPLFLEQAKRNNLNITDPKMTRFNITLEESVKLVIWSILNSYGSEIVVPKIPSYRILDIAKSISPRGKIEIIGIRPGEKLHEEMISFEESRNTIELKNYYIILQSNNKKQLAYYKNKFKGKKLNKQFSYNSNENKDFLSIGEIKKLINIQKINKS
jgi:UDP-N-acetylglucosamine 4,6-dehydratase/5-epimerase